MRRAIWRLRSSCRAWRASRLAAASSSRFSLLATADCSIAASILSLDNTGKRVTSAGSNGQLSAIWMCSGLLLQRCSDLT